MKPAQRSTVFAAWRHAELVQACADGGEQTRELPPYRASGPPGSES